MPKDVARFGERTEGAALGGCDEDLVAGGDQCEQVVRRAEPLEPRADVHLDEEIRMMRLQRVSRATEHVQLVTLDVDEEHLRRTAGGRELVDGERAHLDRCFVERSDVPIHPGREAHDAGRVGAGGVHHLDLREPVQRHVARCDCRVVRRGLHGDDAARRPNPIAEHHRHDTLMGADLEHERSVPEAATLGQQADLGGKRPIVVVPALRHRISDMDRVGTAAVPVRRDVRAEARALDRVPGEPEAGIERRGERSPQETVNHEAAPDEDARWMVARMAMQSSPGSLPPFGAFMRRFATLLTLVFLAACNTEVDASTRPSSVVGTYALQTYGGRSLPTVVSNDAGGVTEVVSGELVIGADNTWSETRTYRMTTSGASQTASFLYEGSWTYVRDQASMLFNLPSLRAQFTGIAAGGSVTLSMSDGSTVVYSH